MKRLISTLVLVLLVTLSSSAQVGFGIKGGVNVATVGGADVTGTPKTLTGFVGGAYLDFDIPFLVTIQPEVLYSMKGYGIDESVTFSGTTYSATGTANLNYLEIPVLIKYSFPVPVVKPSVFVGPSMGILLNAKVKVDVTGQPTQETDIKSNTTGTDWGFVFGASANILVVTVDVRYTLGLTSLDKSGSSKVYNHVWSITAGIPL
jgi:hypothetical protein